MLSALGRGYAVVSINYRLSNEARWPAQIEDAKAAIRFLRAHATRYDLDPARIAVWGDSAGGGLAALLGTTGGVSALTGPNPGDAGQSDRVQAVVDWFGPIDYARLDAQLNKGGGWFSNRSNPDSPQAQLFGAALSTIPEKVRAADATNYITRDDPPFLIEHGTEDVTIPVEQSRDFAAALTTTLGADNVTFKEFAGAGHMDPVFAAPDNIDLVLGWLDARLK
jgi:acetyl esterase/lipase